MQVIMSNPGLEFAMIGNPGPRRRRRRPQKKRKKAMAFTKKQAQGLAKGFRKRSLPVPAKIRRKLKRNPKRSSQKRGWAGRRKIRQKTLKKRRALAKRYRRKVSRGTKVVARRKKGRRKTNRKFSKRTGIRTGRRGNISFRRRRRTIATNPARAVSVKTWTDGITNLPSNLGSIFKGKKMAGNVLFAAGGVLTSATVGNLARGAVLGAIGNAMPGIASNRIVQGVLGAATSYTSGYLIGKMVIKNKSSQNAFITGSAVAAIVSAIFPGQINAMLTSIPVIGPQLAVLPGMDGYVSAPSYQGVGTYVEAPGYQGVGMDPSDAVAGIGMDDMLAGDLGTYVEAPGYQGVGMYGQSHLDQ